MHLVIRRDGCLNLALQVTKPGGQSSNPSSERTMLPQYTFKKLVTMLFFLLWCMTNNIITAFLDSCRSLFCVESDAPIMNGTTVALPTMIKNKEDGFCLQLLLTLYILLHMQHLQSSAVSCQNPHCDMTSEPPPHHADKQ
jgi:hypothetical protein